MKNIFIVSQQRIEAENILKLLNENICSFEEIVDKFKSIQDRYNDPSLYEVLYIEKLFQELIQHNKLTQNNLRYLLNKIEYESELDSLCSNSSLIKEILNEFVLNKEIVDKFNIIVENDKWHENDNIHTLFDLIEYCNKDNEEILKLNELNKYVCSFDLTKDQKLELYELIQNNEIAKNRLKEIVDNNLEFNFDFDSLMVYLSKTEKKNLMNI